MDRFWSEMAESRCRRSFETRQGDSGTQSSSNRPRLSFFLYLLYQEQLFSEGVRDHCRYCSSLYNESISRRRGTRGVSNEVVGITIFVNANLIPFDFLFMVGRRFQNILRPSRVYSTALIDWSLIARFGRVVPSAQGARNLLSERPQMDRNRHRLGDRQRWGR